MENNKRILLLSAYDTPSHSYWSNLMRRELNDYEVTYLKLPARYFAWRIRGNSLTWGTGDFDPLEHSYDLILTTSLVDITALRGFRPNLSSTPLVVYFHENQFAYPTTDNQVDSIQAQLLSIYNAACGDILLFNSQFNRKTFLDGARALLKKLPDGIPSDLLSIIKEKARVLPVPLDCDNIRSLSLGQKDYYQLLWNHRWEYDKQPELLLKVLQRIKNKLPFRIAVVGQQFRQSPAAFEQIKKEFSEQIVAWGYQPTADYQTILGQSDIVLSTALHDFQGLAIQDAMAAGCVPICPDRLAYPEYVDPQLLYQVSAENKSVNTVEYEADNMAQKLIDLCKQGHSSNNEMLLTYSKSSLIPEYRSLFNQLIANRLKH